MSQTLVLIIKIPSPPSYFKFFRKSWIIKDFEGQSDFGLDKWKPSFCGCRGNGDRCEDNKRDIQILSAQYADIVSKLNRVENELDKSEEKASVYFGSDENGPVNY